MPSFNKNTIRTHVFLILLLFSIGTSEGQLNPGLVKIYKGNKSLPGTWLTGKVPVKATKFRGDSALSLNEIEKALGKYPKNFNSPLKNIFVVGTLTLSGKKCQGTHTDENIYISARHNDDIEKLFHREFAEMLLKYYPGNFNPEEWNKTRFSLKLNTDPYATDKTISQQELNPVLFQEGYLTNYSLTGWESDFATYAENLFAGGRQFWQVVDFYPLIKQKALLVIKFYHSLYPIYTENWFRFIADFRLF